LVLLGMALSACGGGGASTQRPSSAESPHAEASARAPAEPAPAGAPSAGAQDGGGARPFASTAEEATHLIDAAVDSRREGLLKCVVSSRARKADPHASVTLELGIDQQGKLIGLKLPKGVQDDALIACARDALRDAPFPTSHAGVVSVKKTFEDEVVYR
jgi:hypothetical protein